MFEVLFHHSHLFPQGPRTSKDIVLVCFGEKRKLRRYGLASFPCPILNEPVQQQAAMV